MGQKHPSTKSTSVIIMDPYPTHDAKSSEHNINPSHRIDDSDLTFGYCCCSVKNKKNSPETNWRKHMLDQLKDLDLEVWPRQLSKHLKKYDANVDAFYQGDLVYAYKNASVLERKSFSVQSVLSRPREDSLFLEKAEIIPVSDRKSDPQLPERRFPNETVQGLLESAPILDEKFYEDNKKETWMEKSFDIKPQHAQMMSDSIRKLKPAKATVSTGKKKGKKLPEFYRSRANSAEYTRKHIEKYKNNTFINLLPSTAESKQDETDDLYQTILKYKTVTQTIDRHIKQKKNVFYQLLSKFGGYFEETYTPILQKAKRREISPTYLSEVTEKATIDLQQFIRIIFEGLCSYYRFNYFENDVQGLKDVLFNRDNLINFITSLVFTGQIYSIIFEFYRLEDSDIENAYQKNLKHCRKFKPQDFGVADEYCLNEATIQYFKAKNMLSDKTREKEAFYLGCLAPIEEQKTENRDSQYSKLTSELVGDSKNELADKHEIQPGKQYQPFRDAILALSNLKYRHSPIHKLKNIVRVAELVTKSIEGFYGEFNLVNGNKLDADQTLSIFLYVASRSGITDLTAHCKVIEKFSTNNILSSVSGYYATTLEACVNCICAMKFNNESGAERMGPEFKEFMRSVGWSSVGGTNLSCREIEN